MPAAGSHSESAGLIRLCLRMPTFGGPILRGRRIKKKLPTARRRGWECTLLLSPNIWPLDAVSRSINDQSQPRFSIYRQVFWLPRPLCLPVGRQVSQSEADGVTAAGPPLIFTGFPFSSL